MNQNLKQNLDTKHGNKYKTKQVKYEELRNKYEIYQYYIY